MGNNRIKTSIFRIQVYDSMCGYFRTGFVFMFKSRIDFEIPDRFSKRIMK